MLKSTFSALQRCHWQYWSSFIRLAVIASQICEIVRNSQKIRTYSSLRSFKVIDLRCQSEQLPINSNFGRIYYLLHRFRDIDALSSTIACFLHPTFVDAGPSGGMSCDINVIYTTLKSTFNRLQFVSSCCLPNLQNPTKSKVKDLGVMVSIESACDLIVTHGVSEISTFTARK